MLGPKEIDASMKIDNIAEGFIYYNERHHDLYVCNNLVTMPL